MRPGKRYLTSLTSYVGWSMVFWFLVAKLSGNPLSLHSALISAALAVVFHWVFVWKSK